ncbi:reverse transcriptase-like protein, partial [Escherichia coli]|uniref:reverse transcriptase-like protein n=1 Tax=Escherichia coli TaxID=562 RepID=UPI00375505E6
MVSGFELAIIVGIRRLHIFMDSLLVVNQVKGEYEARGGQMIKYQELIATLCEQLHQVFIEQILHKQNSQADALSKLSISEGAADMSN